MDDESWYQTIGIPGLMRAARGSYAAVIREELATAGFDDLPRNGALALGLLIDEGELIHLTSRLGVRRQAEADLIDKMVIRGYLERTVGDSGQAALRPTDRGRAAVDVAGQAGARVDAMLEQQLGAGGFRTFRQGLLALARLRQEGWTDSD
jgi:DNA-binding MarR family transcriptional regulator